MFLIEKNLLILAKIYCSFTSRYDFFVIGKISSKISVKFEEATGHSQYSQGAGKRQHRRRSQATS